MAYITSFAYTPTDSESEKASNGYLMSLIAIMAGMPLPIINLIATGIFYLGHRSSSFFVRWHCTQALLSQLFLLGFNSYAFYWVLSILLGSAVVTNSFITYILVIFILNLLEFSITIYAAVNTRKGRHVEWWFFGPLTNLIVKR